jgi:Rrf2 family protein
MRLTQTTRYALSALDYLASLGQSKPVPSYTIARELGLREKFLLKALRPLVNAQLLRSLKGPNGGYVLARPASKVTLLEVVEAIEGPVRGQAPTAEDRVKGRGDFDAQLQEICDRAADALRKAWGKVRLADLAE